MALKCESLPPRDEGVRASILVGRSADAGWGRTAQSALLASDQYVYFPVPANETLYILLNAPGLSYLEPREFALPMQSVVFVCIDLASTCTLNVTVTGLPVAALDERALFLTQAGPLGDASVAASFGIASSHGQGSEYQFVGISRAVAHVALEMRFAGQRVQMSSLGNPSGLFLPCLESQIVVAPSQEIAGLCLVDQASTVLSGDFQVEVGDVNRSEPITSHRGHVWLPAKTLSSASVITFIVDDRVVRRQVADGLSLAPGLLGFCLDTPAKLQEGSILVEALGPARVAEERPRVQARAVDSKYLTPHVADQLQDGAFHLDDLAPGSYEIAWIWTPYGKRVFDTHVPVYPEMRTDVSARMPSIRQYLCVVKHWDQMAPAIRPVQVFVEGCSATLDGGEFRLPLAYPFATKASWRTKQGRTMSGSITIYTQDEHAVVELPVQLSRISDIYIDRFFDGRMGATYAHLPTPDVVGGLRPFGFHTMSANGGPLEFSCAGEEKLWACVWEYHGMGRVFRGWLDDVCGQAGARLSMPGRHVQVGLAVSVLPDGGAVTLLLRRGRIGPWLPPMVDLGSFANQSSFSVWMPDEGQEVGVQVGEEVHFVPIQPEQHALAIAF
jgi:hypothetical protein